MSLSRLYEELIKKYPGCEEWESATWADTVGDDNADMAMAAIMLSTSRAPWESLRAFLACALLLNDRPFFYDIPQPVSVKELAYAVDYMQREFPGDAFNDEVTEGIASAASEEGIAILPETLHFAQRCIPLQHYTDDVLKLQEAHTREIAAYIAAKKRAEQ